MNKVNISDLLVRQQLSYSPANSRPWLELPSGEKIKLNMAISFVYKPKNKKSFISKLRKLLA